LDSTSGAGKQIITGAHGAYCWLTSSEHCIGALVRLCPDLVLGRHLAVTSIDSGTAWLTDRQQASGWRLHLGIAYSPPIAAEEELFYQTDGVDFPGFDEWYVFNAPPAEMGEVIQGNPFTDDNRPGPGRLMAFVNWFIVLHSPEPGMQVLLQMFWRQLEWIQPDAYIADGSECLTFVCKNSELFDSVFQRLNDALS
jgi:hypothetical protein